MFRKKRHGKFYSVRNLKFNKGMNRLRIKFVIKNRFIVCFEILFTDFDHSFLETHLLDK